MYLCTALALVLVVAFQVQFAHGQNCSNTNPCPFKGRTAKLSFPNQHVSSNGELQINLTVDVTKLQFEWFTFWRRTYNGKFPAPTWRVKQGDRIKLNLTNNLSLDQSSGMMNEQRYPNKTNIHTHGLHISSKAPGDNVFTKVLPGQSYDYVFDIDSQNPAGTYWYHPHVHGSTFLQIYLKPNPFSNRAKISCGVIATSSGGAFVNWSPRGVQSGMAGMIVVEDPVNASTPQHIQDVSCPNNCQHDIQLLLQPALMYWSPDGKGFVKLQKEIKDDPYFRTERFNIPGGNTLADWLKNENNAYYFMVNGNLFPTLDLTTGVMKRFRMVNAGGNAVLDMTITGENASPLNKRCKFMEIAVDGVYLDKAVEPKQGKSYMVPATRIDWLVVCDRPGIYEVRSLNEPLTVGDAMGNAERFNKTLFYLNVTGLATTTTIPTSLPKRPWFVGDFRNLTQDQVKGRHVIEVNPKSRLNRLKFQGKGYPRFQLEVNTVQEWYITNTNADSYHPIHIHINHFQVISYNKYTGPVTVHKNNKQVFFDQTGKRCFYQPTGYSSSDQGTFPRKALDFLGHENKWLNETIPGVTAYSRPGVFRDTIHIPPMSNITIRFYAHKYTGTAVVHCHILKHEDKGMMYTFEITEPGSSNLTVYDKAGNGYPGQCQKCDPFPFNQVVNCGGTSSTNAPVGQPVPPVGAGGSIGSTTGSSSTSSSSGQGGAVGSGPGVSNNQGGSQTQSSTGAVPGASTTIKMKTTSGATNIVFCSWILCVATMTVFSVLTLA